MLPDLLVQIVPSLVVGFGGAWLATQKALSAYAERLGAAEKNIASLDTRVSDAHTETVSQTIAVVERLTRVETKIDVWMQRMERMP